MAGDNLKELLFAFSEEIRLRILVLLGRGSALCVKCIVGVINAPQPTVSRHLSILRRSGVVEVLKYEQRRYYSIKKRGPVGGLSEGIADFFYKSLKDKKPFNRDFKKLRKIGGACRLDCKVNLKAGA